MVFTTQYAFDFEIRMEYDKPLPKNIFHVISLIASGFFIECFEKFLSIAVATRALYGTFFSFDGRWRKNVDDGLTGG